jgi:putative membrane protein
MTTTSLVATVLAEHADGSGHGWWPLWPLLWIAVLATIVWLFFRRTGGRDRDPTDQARGILAERFARGELSADEYRERLAQLG